MSNIVDLNAKREPELNYKEFADIMLLDAHDLVWYLENLKRGLMSSEIGVPSHEVEPIDDRIARLQSTLSVMERKIERDSR